MKKVLIAVDNKREAERAFIFYTENIHKKDDQVIILHVYESVRIPASFHKIERLDEDDIISEAKRIQNQNQTLEEKYSRLCTVAKIKYETLSLPMKDSGVGAVVVEHVKATHADMVVVGTRALGALKRTFLGSVSNYVIHHCTVPVCVCPDVE